MGNESSKIVLKMTRDQALEVSKVIDHAQSMIDAGSWTEDEFQNHIVLVREIVPGVSEALMGLIRRANPSWPSMVNLRRTLNGG